MRQTRFSILAICLLQFVKVNVFGQIPVPPQHLPSPNAASLGQYGDYPVSHFTGLPRIEIPLYELKAGEVSLPISLSYHASGVRPDQHPGWVGMGWSFNAGGVITRSVNDLPDEFNNSNLYHGTNAGYYYNYNVLNRNDWNSTSYMQTVAGGDPSLKDTEPDEFSFSLPNGTSGKFYRTHIGGWSVRCDRPVSIELTTTTMLSVPFSPPSGSPYINYGYYKSFAGFIITDEFGVQYTFGAKANTTSTDAIEYSTVFFNQNEDDWTATSWYLVNIKGPYQDAIDLTYSRDSFIAQMFISVNNNLGTSTVNTGGFLNPSCYSWNYSDIGASYRGNLISPVYLTEISNGIDKVKMTRSNTTELRYTQSTFNWQYTLWSQSTKYSSFLPFLEDNNWDTYPANLSKLQWKKLDQVRIESEGILQKAFNFAYSNSTTQRLTLLSITEQGKNGGLLKPHAFSYDNSKVLPGYLANMNDHWGFYNGTYADISNQNNYYINYANYRVPKYEYLFSGTLDRITYPTGGITDFTYEAHDYMKEVKPQRELAPYGYPEASLAGGLRIRKIKSYDPLLPEQFIEKEYLYNEILDPEYNYGYASSGILGGSIKYYFNDYRVRSSNNSALIYSQSLFSSQSVLPGNYNSNGSHIGYTTVFEKLNDGSYTRFDYSNYDDANCRDMVADANLQPQRSIYDPYASKEMNRGQLLRERNYTSSNILLKDRVITYAQSGASSGTEVRSLKAQYFNVCQDVASSVFEATAYKFLTHSYLPVSEVVNDYDQSGANPVTASNSLTYDSTYGKLKKQELSTDSKGLQHRTTYRYAFDVSTVTPGFPPDPDLLPIFAMKSDKKIGIPLETVSSTLFSTGEVLTDVEVNIYSGYYDPWATYPSGRYKLKKQNNILKSNYIPFTASLGGGGEKNNIDPNLSLKESYRFEPFGASPFKLRQTGYQEFSSGTWNHYIWGYGGRYAVAVVLNGDASIAYTGFENTDKGNWTYGGATTADATAPTGSRVYNLSSGAISRTSLDASKSYILNYWANSGSASSISGGAATSVRNYNGWTLYKRILTGVSSVTLSGNIAVDDLRLYPSDASMTSYTFNGSGLMTSETDSRGDIRYYEYDEFNRLKTVRDNQGRILADHTYNLR